jgi:hypothetical protein
VSLPGAGCSAKIALIKTIRQAEQTNTGAIPGIFSTAVAPAKRRPEAVFFIYGPTDYGD